MAIILLVCIVVTASAAPLVSDGVYRDWQQEYFDRMELNKLQEGYLSKRSNYGNYVSPCAAAASAPLTTYASAATTIPAYAPGTAPTPYSYHTAYQTVPVYQGHVPTHYGQHYYRSEDEIENEQEMLGFSDMNHAVDHLPIARYSYSTAPISQGSAASGSVVGVFSNANVKDCSVPLLVSCSPSIAHGRMVMAQPYSNIGATSVPQGNLYRVVDEKIHHHEPEGHKEKAALSSSEHSLHDSISIGDKHQ